MPNPTPPAIHERDGEYMTLKEQIEKITEDYGQLHEEGCDLNDENGSDYGCTCAVKAMVSNVSEAIIEYLSHDICDNKIQGQREEIVKMYISLL